jgi:hypothetical protein
MTQNPTDKKTCNVCQQSFNSELELQEHQKKAHSQQKQGGNPPMSDRSQKDQPGQQQERRDKIA